MTPILSEGSISVPGQHIEPTIAQRAVTEQLAHLSTVAKRAPPPQLQRPVPSIAAAAAVAGPAATLDASSGKARKQAQAGQPVPEAAWEGGDGVPDEKRLFTVRQEII